MSIEMRNQVWMDGNQIYFFASFTTETVNELIKLIMKGKDKKDLTINVKSYGGAVNELFIAMDLVRKYDIRVHVMGYAMSAGFYLMCAAKKRSMEPTSILLYHEISYGHQDTTTGHVRELEDSVYINDAILKKVVTDTGANIAGTLSVSGTTNLGKRIGVDNEEIKLSKEDFIDMIKKSIKKDGKQIIREGNSMMDEQNIIEN